jgi:hypothetical protein
MLGGLISVSESLVSFLPAEPAPTEIVLEFPREKIYEANYSLVPLAAIGGIVIPPEFTASVAMIQGMVDAYNANVIVVYTSMVTMPDDNQQQVPLNLFLFDSILSFEYQANLSDPESVPVQVSIRKELSVFADCDGFRVYAIF